MNDLSQSKKQRKPSIVFWTFIIFSIPLMIVVIGYAAGYRFDSQTGTVTEHALISVDTMPKGATVLINGVVQTQLTPFMQTVVPGEYTILVQRDGYQDWQKRVTLEEGRSASFPSVVLFQDSMPFLATSEHHTPPAQLRSLTAEESAVYASHGYTHVESLLLLEGPKTVLVDSVNNSTWLLDSPTAMDTAVRIGDACSDAEWDSAGTELLFMNSLELWTYSVDTQKTVIWRRQSTPLVDATWSTDSSEIFYSDTEGISAIEQDERGVRQQWRLATVASATHLYTQKGHLFFTAEGQTYDMPYGN